MAELSLLLAAFVIGIAFKQAGFPALTGYLAAGFLASAAMQNYADFDLNVSALNEAGHIGVLILLFTIGLKLDIKKIVKPEIIGSTLIHFIAATAVTTPVFWLSGTNLQHAILIAGLLVLSSTVLAAKVLESKLEIKAEHGRLAIGMLIAQDIIAMCLLSVYSDITPNWYALGLILLLLAKPLLNRLISLSGHDETLLLCALTLALIAGGAGFKFAGLSSELGALVMGAILAGHEKANEISEKLWGLKELCLVSFFLSIGLHALPDAADFKFALLACLLLPFHGFILFYVLTRFKIAARPAFLTTTTLTNYSEFSLIVGAIVLPELVPALALAITMSFVISAPLNRFSHKIFARFESKLDTYAVRRPEEDEARSTLEGAHIVILGMGRVGQATYSALKRKGQLVVGIDSDKEKVATLKAKGLDARFADGEHDGYWEKVDLTGTRSFVLCMNCSEANTTVTRILRQRGYTGFIIAHSHYTDEAREIKEAGADSTYLTYTEAGEGLAMHILQRQTV